MSTGEIPFPDVVLFPNFEQQGTQFRGKNLPILRRSRLVRCEGNVNRVGGAFRDVAVVETPARFNAGDFRRVMYFPSKGSRNVSGRDERFRIDQIANGESREKYRHYSNQEGSFSDESEGSVREQA